MGSISFFQYVLFVDLIAFCGTATNTAAAEQSLPLTGHTHIQGKSKVTPLQSFRRVIEQEGAKTANVCKGTPDGDYIDPNNPYGYITCLGGQTIHKLCPPGKMWDDNKKICVMQFKRLTMN